MSFEVFLATLLEILRRLAKYSPVQLNQYRLQLTKVIEKVLEDMFDDAKCPLSSSDIGYFSIFPVDRVANTVCW